MRSRGGRLTSAVTGSVDCQTNRALACRSDTARQTRGRRQFGRVAACCKRIAIETARCGNRRNDCQHGDHGYQLR